MEVSEIVDIAYSIGQKLAEKVVQSAEVNLDFDWGAFDKTALANTLGEMKDTSRVGYEAIEDKFSFISEMKTVAKNRLLIFDFLGEVNLLPADAKEREAFLMNKSTVKVAAYAATVITKEMMKVLRERTAVNTKSSSGWKHFELELFSDIDPNAVDERKDELAAKIREFVQEKEKCAEYGEPLVFRKGASQVFVLKLDDRPSELEILKKYADGYRFEDIAVSPTIKLAVILDEKNQRIGVHHRKGNKAREIAELFCNIALGRSCYKIVGDVIYDLEYFAKNSQSTMGGKRDSPLKGIRVVELYVDLAGVKDSRRTYFEVSNDLYETIRKELDPIRAIEWHDAPDSVFPIGTRVRRVKLRVDFDGEKPNMHRTFDLTPTTIDGFNEIPRNVRDALLEVLAEKKIALRREIKDDPSTGASHSPKS